MTFKEACNKELLNTVEEFRKENRKIIPRHLAKSIIDKYGLGLNPKHSADKVIVLLKENNILYDTCNAPTNSNDHKALKKECEEKGIPIESVTQYWYKSKSISLFAKTDKFDNKEFRETLLLELTEKSPIYTSIKYNVVEDSNLLIIDISDLHLNKLATESETGEIYNLQIARQRVFEGVNAILNKVKGFSIDKILYIAGNDKLHTDNSTSTTTRGTYQDTEVMWYDAFVFAVNLEIEVLELLMSIAPIHYQYDPSNHDYTNGFFLAQTIQARFHNCENITFDVSPKHRKYFIYGKNIIGSTHGDGAKEQDLGQLMAHEASEHWHYCRHRYFYTHHIHHKRSKDYMSVCVESLRSPSGTDSWHSKNGYQHSPKGVEAFLHHKEQGQVARISYIF